MNDVVTDNDVAIDKETRRRGDKERRSFVALLVSLSPHLLVFFALLFVAAATSVAQEPRVELRYPYGPDSLRQEGVPRGSVTEHVWKDSKIFPGTIRRYYVYVPAQYDASKPAALMVFQDGHTYIGENGDFRVPVVFDNLIHKGEMPVTIGVFVDPGHKKPELPPEPGWQPQPENRAFEYDSLTPDYAEFLLTEILPQVRKDLNITDDPEGHAICGISSGGICAFTVAWQRPDEFRKVLSHVGSFVNIRGGDVYPGLIRKQHKRPMRVFLQDGENDLDNEHGNWPLANKQMVAALKYRDYDVNFVYGEGGHNGNHGGAILPDSLRWLWRDYEFPVKLSYPYEMDLPEKKEFLRKLSTLRAGAPRHLVVEALGRPIDERPVVGKKYDAPVTGYRLGYYLKKRDGGVNEKHDQYILITLDTDHELESIDTNIAGLTFGNLTGTNTGSAQLEFDVDNR